MRKCKKKLYKNSKFKISAPTWTDGSISRSKYYFDFIIKNHETQTNNSPIRTCVNKIENRITLIHGY